MKLDTLGHFTTLLGVSDMILPNSNNCIFDEFKKIPLMNMRARNDRGLP